MNSKVCKRRLCNKVFIKSKSIKYQVFCSKICCDRQGKEDWKIRNKEKYNKLERIRKNKKYKLDKEYSTRKKLLNLKYYHSLTDTEKFIRGKTNRLRENKDNKRNYMKNYHSYRSKYDIVFKLTGVLRARVRGAIKNNGGVKSIKTMELIGCSVNECMEHLEKQFDKKMSWENYGKWHIDHIIPVNYFSKNYNFNSIKVQKKCFNYKNLQPLWATDNLQKGIKLNATI